jgi:transcriptional regulator with XRE-family HTH domain
MSIDFTNADLKKIVSRKLELLRQQSAQTIDSAAYELDMDRSEFFRILKGKRLPMLRSMFRISRKYGVSMDWWFEDVDRLPQKPAKDPLKSQLLRAFKKLDTKSQNNIVIMLKALAKSQR